MRRLLNGLAIPTLIVMLLAFLDASISSFLEPDTLFRALSGQSLPVSGVLDNAVEGGQESSGLAEARYDPNTLVRVDPASQAFQINFKEVKGRIWRGELVVREDAEPGEHGFWVHGRYDKPSKESEVYVLRVFADKASYRADFRSMSMRLLGVKPWILGVSLLPVGVLLLGLSFLLSSREESRRQALGIGSIYKLAKRDDHWEVIFGLGSKHGVSEGDRLVILDRGRARIGDLVAQKVRADFSIAQVALETPLAPGLLVARSQMAGRR